MKKILGILGKIVAGALTFSGVLLSTAIFWMLDTWQNLTIDEMLYHLRAPKTGTDSGIIFGFMTRSLLPAVLVLLVFLFLNVFWKKRRQIYGVILMAFSMAAAVFSTMHVWKVLDVGNYLKNASAYSSFIDENYVYPSSVEITFPEEKRNLIYIFLESMETTFADHAAGGAFHENFIPNLTDLALEYENFNGNKETLNGGIVLNKCTYTMAGIYAESMGLPLILPFTGNAMESQESFVPELDGIGDLLEANGYQNTLLIGSQAVFGGRDLFYRDHGNYEILDYDYAKKTGVIPEDYYVFWGYEDQRLFELAKKEISEEAASGQPFNMTLLTVDTHFEDGYFCQACEKLHGDNVYADVYNCADRQISEFVSWIQQQEFYKNTTIVLVGDHLTMDSDFCAEVEDSYERKVYLSIINGAAEPELDVMRSFSTLDLFPTTLAALGVNIEGNRLGLGTNLYSSEQTLLEQYGKEEINTAFEKKSAMMEHLNAAVDMERYTQMQKEEGYEQEWYYEAVQYVFNRNLLEEDSLEFAPEQSITNALAIQALYNLEGKPEPGENPSDKKFSKINEQWYANAMRWAVSAGLISTKESGAEYQADTYMTREGLAELLYRYAAYKQLDGSIQGDYEGLENTEQVSEWAEAGVKWAVGTGLIGGIDGRDLAPLGMVSQAQLATILMRLCEYYGL